MKPMRLYLGDAEQALAPVSVPAPAGAARPRAVWDLDAAPHALCAGGTGGGKSVLMRTAARSAILAGALAFFIDGKEGGGFACYKGCLGVGAVETDPVAAAALIAYWHAEMRRRYQVTDRILAEAVTTRTIPDWPDAWQRWILFLDELNSLLAMLPDTPGHPLGRRATNSRLVDLGRRARECGMHLFLTAQRPKAQALDAGLDSELKGQLGLRIALGEIDSALAGMVFDEYAIKVNDGEHVPRGRGILQVGTVHTRFQAPDFPNPYARGVPLDAARRALALLPPPDPSWQMWSVRQGLFPPDPIDPQEELAATLDAAKTEIARRRRAPRPAQAAMADSGTVDLADILRDAGLDPLG